MDDFDKSTAVLQWRYALRLVASAPRTLTSITIGLDFVSDVPYEDLAFCTIASINWAAWGEVLRRFENLRSVTFTNMADDPRFGHVRYYEPYVPRGPLDSGFAMRLGIFILRQMHWMRSKVTFLTSV